MGQPNATLAHYGVLGMKWGVRKDKSAGKAAAGTSDDVARVLDSAKKVKQGGTKTLSNKELQELVTRMNLEQQFARLTAEQRKSKITKGKKFVSGVLATGKTVNEVMAFANSPAGKLIRAQLK